ncbi:recombinase family protein [Variovorax sp. W1I1]|uniref:recombinase family protein n=1 Tax=Variovorax sp. W1I1 TaxID=3042309 RepID=UPI0027D8D785|nr:recombinase family protein [Variovorax sp. W1I1]
MLYGYARVSTLEQENHTQIDALRKVGVDFLFEEKRSGGDSRRPVLNGLLNELQKGDTLVVYKLDRVARSLKHLLNVIDELASRDVQFHSLTEHIDTASPAGRMLLQMLGAFAEFELAMIRERTKAGLAAAVARGAKPGRPRAMSPLQEAEAVRLFKTGGMTKSAIARRYGTHISSIKRALARAAGQAEMFN